MSEQQIRCRVSRGNAYSTEWVPMRSAIAGHAVNFDNGTGWWHVVEVLRETRDAPVIGWHEHEGTWAATVGRYSLFVYYKYDFEDGETYRWKVEWRDDDGGHYEDAGHAGNPMWARDEAVRAMAEAEAEREET